MALRRRHFLAGLGALGLGGWRAAQPIGSAFTGTVRMIGPGQTYATIAAAHAAAANFDRLICVAGTPRETLTITKEILLDISACVWNFTGFPSTSLAGGGKGALEFFTTTNAMLIAGEISGVGMDLTSGDLTSAVRVTAATGNVSVHGGFLHNNQNGIGSGASAATITVNGTRLLSNGLLVNSGSATHNMYFGEGAEVVLINVDSRAPIEAHALKSRAAITRAYGGFYESPNGASFDLPEGGQFELRNLTMQKLNTAASGNFLNYATESAAQGLMNGNSIRNVVLDLNLSGQVIHTLGGQITFGEGCSRTAFPPGPSFGGGVVIGIPA